MAEQLKWGVALNPLALTITHQFPKIRVRMSDTALACASKPS